jgi:xanthine dehydrogenase FAD-binding subunit
MPKFETYEAPSSLKEALEILAEHKGRVRTIAGGTDVLVRLKRGTLPDGETILLSVKNIPELHTIETTAGRSEGGGGGALRIGAAVTVHKLEIDETILSSVRILSDVANKMASAQIRATATIGGNLAKASPAADLAIPLILLDAEVETARLGSKNEIAKETIPVERFFTGPGECALDETSLVTAVRVPLPAEDARFICIKGGVRPAMECAVVSVGCGVLFDKGGAVDSARVAFGAVAPTPVRAHDIESYLTGNKITDDRISGAVALVDQAIHPISDIRGSESYRRELTKAQLKTVLYEMRDAGSGAGSKGGPA